MTGSSSQFRRLDEEVPSPVLSTPPPAAAYVAEESPSSVKEEAEEEELERWEESNLRPH